MSKARPELEGWRTGHAPANPKPIPRLDPLRHRWLTLTLTADLEKSFLVQLARHAGTEPEMLHVLSRTAGSVILDIEVRAQNASEVVAKVVGTGLDELSQVMPSLVRIRVSPASRRGTQYSRRT